MHPTRLTPLHAPPAPPPAQVSTAHLPCRTSCPPAAAVRPCRTVDPNAVDADELSRDAYQHLYFGDYAERDAVRMRMEAEALKERGVPHDDIVKQLRWVPGFVKRGLLLCAFGCGKDGGLSVVCWLEGGGAGAHGAGPVP